MDAPSSALDRLFVRARRPWVTLGILVVLLGAPLLAAYADKVLDQIFELGWWRGVYVPPAVISYILLVSPRMAGVESAVLRSIRPALQIDDDQFNELVHRNSRSDPRKEALIFVAGALVGLATNTYGSGFYHWLGVEALVSVAVMYGLLAWAVYGSVLTTRLTSELLRQPLRIDPFDTTPFEPMGRQSLLLALVFVGGITLSLPFVLLQPGALGQPIFWVVYIPLTAVPVVIFFLGMAPVHRVLTAARDHERQIVEQHLVRLSRELMLRLEGSMDVGGLPTEINAISAYDQRLQSAPTWPYNTGMLRTLIFSVLVPGATLLGKILIDLFLG